MFFSFPPDARWNPERDAVEFTVEIGDYRSVVHIRRQVFRRFLDGAATPSVVSRPITCNGRASSASSNANCANGSSPRMAMSRSPAAICARGPTRARDPGWLRRLCEMLTDVPAARRQATVAL
jgi:hypothetical protein